MYITVVLTEKKKLSRDTGREVKAEIGICNYLSSDFITKNYHKKHERDKHWTWSFSVVALTKKHMSIFGLRLLA